MGADDSPPMNVRSASFRDLDRVEKADCLEGEARAAASRRLLFEAAAAGRRAEEWTRRLERARELAARQASRPAAELHADQGKGEGEIPHRRVPTYGPVPPPGDQDQSFLRVCPDIPLGSST